jgi:release factor glutamine methyltransferase
VIEHLLTLDRLIAHAGTRLRVAGVAEPKREAWRIWADLQGRASHAADILSDVTVADPDAERFRQAINRRAAGEPLPYVTGVAGFRNLALRSDPRALIPRPETEGLVELLLGRAPAGRVADVGTGSGCIALALAEEGRYDLVLGVDRCRPALQLAADNCRSTGLGVALIEGDLVQALGTGTLDAIVSNPPYLTEAEYHQLDASVKNWEPREALVGGADGLESMRPLLLDGWRVVRAGGWLAFEVDATRARDTARIADEIGWNNVTVHDDLFGRARYLLARRSEAL